MTRGKMLGGCSSNNYEVYTRGVPQDYEEWAKVAPGWDWNKCLHYFKKLENMTDWTVFDNPYNAYLHSTEGPVLVSRPTLNTYNNKINEIMLESYQELGLKKVKENNGPDIDGITQPHFTFADGRRSSTAEAYLRRTKNRPNLYVAKYARVTKILIDPLLLKSYGVEVLLNNSETINIYADMEIIVSAGTIDSPKLLMLSGIGPKANLKKYGINVLADLPVGKNLHDHAFAPILFVGKQGLESALPNLLITTELDSYPFPLLNGLVRLDYSKNKPDYQIFSTYAGAAASLIVNIGCQTVGNYDEAFCASLAKANAINEMFLTLILLLHPLSRGQVSLKSRDPLDDPLIELGYFRNEVDLYKLTEGVKFLVGLGNTTYFRKIDGSIVKPDVIACRSLKWGSDDYWKCYVKHTVNSMLHPVGTCKMGKDGVVDERLRVHGIYGLRVADASIMPQISSGNTNAPTMMIGEHAADIIKEEYGELFNRQYF